MAKDPVSRVISVFAILVSALALGHSIWQGRETRLHYRLSMRPVVDFESIRVPTEPWPGVGFYIANHGNGPALLESLTVYVDGEPVGGLAGAARMLDLADDPDFRYITRLPTAISPRDERLIFGFNKDDYTQERAPVLREALSRFTKLCLTYQSVYDERYEVCWLPP